MNLLPFIGKKKSNAQQWIVVALIIGLLVFFIWWFLIRKKAPPIANPGYGGNLDPNAGGNNSGGNNSGSSISSVSTATDALHDSISGWFGSADSKNSAAQLAYGFSNAQIIALANDWNNRYTASYGSGLYTAMDNEVNVPFFTVGTNYWDILKERLKTANATN